WVYITLTEDLYYRVGKSTEEKTQMTTANVSARRAVPNWCARFKGWAVVATLLTALVAAFVPSSFAQVSTARIDGFVHDQSGAVIPGATVTLKDEASGLQLHAVTDASGFYDLEGIQPKTYTLTVAMKAFKTSVQEHLTIHADDRL